MKIKKGILFLLIIELIFTTGCWDRVEIEQRGIVGAASLDVTDDAEETLNITKQMSANSKINENLEGPLKSVFGVIIPSKIQVGEKAYETIEVKAANMPDSLEKLGQKMSRTPYFAQMRMMYFSEKFIKNQKVFIEALDRLDKSPKINETAYVVVVKGDIDILAKVEPKIESTLAAYILGITENSKITSNTSALPLYKLISNLRNNNGSCAIPVLEVKEKGDDYDLIINKLALIKDYKFLSYLDTKYVKVFRIMNNNFKKGRILVNYEDTIIPYYIYTLNKRIWIEENENKLKFNVKIEFEGDAEEYKFGKEVFNEEIIEKMSKAIEEYAKKEFEETTEYFQKVIGSDYLGFGDYTHKYNNKIYQKYKDNWDEVFRNSEIKYEVKAFIRRIGIAKE
ncbi:Ger(x)C family spore germination protein [Caloramator sp. E03]|uniref:Ger(x)C family spore germination protein n=1 Tax=Caloramator sp. E03 TaxID=2576307 RepID=UPI00110FFB69|nr:Ger(x)C family spore germination protein [Caloramator sp. E03]QCX33413.1 Ger(x)C family spore germination protein [Caloramator sp. E03]